MKAICSKGLAGILLLTALGVTLQAAAPDSGTDAPSAMDIDIFMEKVLVQRHTNWEALHNYVFREKEVLEFRGGLDIPALQSFRREYVWIVRDGLLVRNPVVVNGVTLSPEEQRAEESRFKPSRTEREGSLGGVPDRESFLTFKFERGNYFFAGRREFRGRPVVVVEYYPEHLFSGDDGGDKYDNMLDKTTLVTMLIDPAEYQIVNVTFDNVGLDFLPGRWLVRVEKLWATMTMAQPVANVWLPEGIRVEARVTTAMGDLTAHYERSFYEYRQTDVKVKFYAGEVLEEKDEK